MCLLNNKWNQKEDPGQKPKSCCSPVKLAKVFSFIFCQCSPEISVLSPSLKLRSPSRCSSRPQVDANTGDPLHILTMSVTAIECSHSAAGAQCDRNPTATPACSALTGELSLSPTSIKPVLLYARIKVCFPRKPRRSRLSSVSNRVKLTELCCIWETLVIV